MTVSVMFHRGVLLVRHRASFHVIFSFGRPVARRFFFRFFISTFLRHLLEKIVVREPPALTTLDLGYNVIGDDGVKELAPVLKGMTALTTLGLSRNKLGYDGAKAFAPVLQGMTALTKLNLEYNEIGDDGAKALAPVLKGMTGLTTLDLEKNKIGADGAKALALAIKQSPGALTNVDLGYFDSSLSEALGHDATAEERALTSNKDLLAYWCSLAPSVTETSTAATGESVSVTKGPVMTYRSKLIICGYGSVGKTSLLNALQECEPDDVNEANKNINRQMAGKCTPNSTTGIACSCLPWAARVPFAPDKQGNQTHVYSYQYSVNGVHVLAQLRYPSAPSGSQPFVASILNTARAPTLDAVLILGAGAGRTTHFEWLRSSDDQLFSVTTPSYNALGGPNPRGNATVAGYLISTPLISGKGVLPPLVVRRTFLSRLAANVSTDDTVIVLEQRQAVLVLTHTSGLLARFDLLTGRQTSSVQLPVHPASGASVLFGGFVVSDSGGMLVHAACRPYNQQPVKAPQCAVVAFDLVAASESAPATPAVATVLADWALGDADQSAVASVEAVRCLSDGGALIGVHFSQAAGDVIVGLRTLPGGWKGKKKGFSPVCGVGAAAKKKYIGLKTNV
jgi:hypothetical protein